MAENTPIAIALALLTLALLAWRLKPSAFRSLPSTSIAVASALFWGVFAAILYSVFWDSYYSIFATPANRLFAPIAAAGLYSLIALLLRWLALRLPGNPVLTFPLLGGLESIPEHAIAINRFGILQIPILRGSTPISIFIFAFFEYVVYWGLVLLLAGLLRRLFHARPIYRTEPEPPKPLRPNNSTKATQIAAAKRR
jgi:hypothetical protein